MSINVVPASAGDRVLDFMTTYVQTHKIPHQELPDLIAKLITTYTSPGSSIARKAIGSKI